MCWWPRSSAGRQQSVKCLSSKLVAYELKCNVAIALCALSHAGHNSACQLGTAHLCLSLFMSSTSCANSARSSGLLNSSFLRYLTATLVRWVLPLRVYLHMMQLLLLRQVRELTSSGWFSFPSARRFESQQVLGSDWDTTVSMYCVVSIFLKQEPAWCQVLRSADMADIMMVITRLQHVLPEEYTPRPLTTPVARPHKLLHLAV